MRSCSPLIPTENGRFDAVLVHCSACGRGDRHILEPPYNYLEKPRRGSQPLGLGRVEVGRYLAGCSDEDADGTARSRFWDGCMGSAANVRGSQPSSEVNFSPRVAPSSRWTSPPLTLRMPRGAAPPTSTLRAEPTAIAKYALPVDRCAAFVQCGSTRAGRCPKRSGSA